MNESLEYFESSAFIVYDKEVREVKNCNRAWVSKCSENSSKISCQDDGEMIHFCEDASTQCTPRKLDQCLKATRVIPKDTAFARPMETKSVIASRAQVNFFIESVEELFIFQYFSVSEDNGDGFKKKNSPSGILLLECPSLSQAQFGTTFVNCLGQKNSFSHLTVSPSFEILRNFRCIFRPGCLRKRRRSLSVWTTCRTAWKRMID